MLQLKDITKDYYVAGGAVHALKGISLNFRKNEFVSILGASGCGKTTLLNIIGGLDKYTSGDLVINGVSTKQYGDRDWDTYRNHSIGFIFQSYHLIPHQTILQNVELALTISGVDKEERRRRAVEALDKVGLKDKMKNLPNQLSGGQAQRVAIARALINDPEIVLADEPTGALDSKTSVQIMELLKEISKDRLVIMVTHNPELAEKYSTRIIRLLDGVVTNDSRPFNGVEGSKAPQEEIKTNNGKKKRSSMSFGMAFMLSLKNLLSKFRRTAMVAFAGSIGIIGVSMVLAISAGVQGYIDSMQDDMIAGNPIQITETTLDFSAIMSNMVTIDEHEAIEIEDGYININHTIEYLYERGKSMESMIVSNDITKEYVDYIKAMPKEYYSALDFNYGLDLTYNLYTDFEFSNNHGGIMSLSAAREIFTSMLEKTEFAEYASYVTTLADTFNQAPDNSEFILSQYDFVTSPDKSKIATGEDEIMIVVNTRHELSDLLLAQLGYFTQDEFFNIVYKVTEDERYDSSLDIASINYDKLLNKTFTWYSNNEVYSQNISPNPLISALRPFDYNPFANENWTTGKKLKLTGILVRKEGQNYGCLDSGFYYTPALARAMIEDTKNSAIYKFMTEIGQESITGMKDYVLRDPKTNNVLYTGDIGITYKYDYNFGGAEYKDNTGFVGQKSAMASMIGSAFGLDIPATYTLTLREIGGSDIPSTINIYPVNFDHKDLVTAYLDAWNGNGTVTVNGNEIAADDRAEIVYTDTVGLIINMINTMIKMITIALVAFTALSLVVSTVMVGIITYVSVVERIKEIGILRAVGARKKDIKRLFIAETFIIGLFAGIVGIGITYVLSFIVNMIVGTLAGVYTIAALPVLQAFIMICVSVALTLISGLIPASAAAKKDPVVALRTE